MGYRITYENGTVRTEALRRRKTRWKRWWVGALVSALSVTMMVPQGRLWLRNLLLPGDEEVTASALEGMVEDLRTGESVAEAVEAFCREILTGGT